MAEINTRAQPLSLSQWSELPADILALISDRLDEVGNIRLRSVCSNWRSAVPLLSPASEVPFQSPFPAFDYFSYSSNFSISINNFYFLRSAAVQGNEASPWWLLRVEGKGSFGKFRSLNPFSRSHTGKDGHIPEGFPSEINLLDFQICEIGRAYHFNWRNYSLNRCFSKVVISSDEWIRKSGEEEDYAILALFKGKLGFIESRGENWKQIDGRNQPGYDDIASYDDMCYDGMLIFDDILYSKEKDVFYAVNNWGRLIMIGKDFEPKEFISAKWPLKYGENSYSVESNGELFFVVKQFDRSLYRDSSHHIGGKLPYQFMVYKLNEEKKIWDFVTSLGDLVIFVGCDFSFAVSAQQFGLEGNCIYFENGSYVVVHQSGTNRDIGIVTMKDGSSKIFLKSPAWIKPLKRKSSSEN